MSKQNLSATEQFTRTISIALSQYHSAAISEITKRGMLCRVERGYAVTRPPLGYSKTETPGLFKINLFGTVLREELKDLANGYTTIKSAAIKLALAFDPFDAEPEPWSVTKVKHLLSNPYYAGNICHKGQLYPGLHEPLISEDEYKKLLVVLKNHNGNDPLKSVAKSL